MHRKDRNIIGTVFTDAQRRAVTYGAGRLLIIAGPGSGKTFVITQRIRYLTEELKVSPESVLVMTYSRAAAAEMRDRYGSLCGHGSGGVTFGTFHSFFLYILRTAYGYSPDQVADEQTKRTLLERAVRDTLPALDDPGPLAARLSDMIAYVKEMEISPADYYPGVCTGEEWQKIFSGYSGYMARAGLIDYEDMTSMVHELLLARPDICGMISKRFRWILVDEFQDINRTQYETVRLLTGRNGNLTVVGDDDQSIYGFRGARPEIMRQFPKDWPGTETVILDINFRSTEEVIGTAGRLISRNHRRYRKKIKSARGSGPQVEIRRYRDALSQYTEIADEIAAGRVPGSSGQEGNVGIAGSTGPIPSIGILARMHVQLEYMAGVLDRAGIEYIYHKDDPDSGVPEKDNKIRQGISVELNTFHGSKGLEYDTVYVIDVCEGIVPNKRAGTAEETEEERRAFYVALTRARTGLVICYPMRRLEKNVRPSMFLGELIR